MEHKAAGGILLDWNIFIILICVAIAMLYFVKQRNDKFYVSQKQQIAFYSGVILFIIALGSPIYSLGHYLFSVHMVIQSIIYLAVPPLILYGLSKKEVGEFIGKNSGFKKIITFFTKPIIALLLFNGVFSFYHVPSIFDFLMTSSVYMYLSILVLLVLSFIMWWPVISPVETTANMKPLYKIAYICGMGILLTPACALIIFSKDLLYTSYMHSSQLLGIDPLNDQQGGGALMKIIQEIIYGTVIAVVFFAWSKEQKNFELEDKLNQYEEEYLQNLRNNSMN